jgi:PhnB protein
MSVKPVPEGYHSVTPYITVHDGNAALDYYRQAFGAEEILRLPAGEKIAHAEIRIGDSIVMLSDEWPEMGVFGPKTRGGCTAGLMIYVEDVDSAFPRAIAAGGTEERPVQDQFYGDRSGTLVDPFGHRWTISTHVEDVSEDEMQRRMAAHGAEREAQSEPA